MLQFNFVTWKFSTYLLKIRHVNFSLKFWQKWKSTLKIVSLSCYHLHKYKRYSRLLIFRRLAEKCSTASCSVFLWPSAGVLVSLRVLLCVTGQACRFTVNSEASTLCLRHVNSENGDLWNSCGKISGGQLYQRTQYQCDNIFLPC